LELVARRRARAAAGRGRRRHRARLSPADRAMSAELDAVAAICARQDGAELGHPFGPEAAVYKVAGKIFAVIGSHGSPPELTVKCDPEHGEMLRGEHAAIT